MTSTSLKSPISGTLTSTALIVWLRSSPFRSQVMRRKEWGLVLCELHRHRVRLVRIEAVLLDRIRDHRSGNRSVFRQCLERGNRHVVAIDLEKFAQLLTRIRTSETVSAQDLVVAAFRHE